MIILACVLVCFLLFTGCAVQKSNDEQDTNSGNSVEIDDADIAIDTEPGLDTEDNADDVTLPDGFTYSFRDPDNLKQDQHWDARYPHNKGLPRNHKYG